MSRSSVPLILDRLTVFLPWFAVKQNSFVTWTTVGCEQDRPLGTAQALQGYSDHEFDISVRRTMDARSNNYGNGMPGNKFEIN